MLIDTHCHINMMVKKTFDVDLDQKQIQSAQNIIHEAEKAGVNRIVNVGTSFVESKNCIVLAQAYESMFATIGIHPNDATTEWRKELREMESLITNKKNKIVGVGETGIDKHYPHYNLQMQIDAFRAQIELALQYELGLVIHSRDAYDETLRVIEEYVRHEPRAVMHCFSYDLDFARQVVSWGMKIGIGGTITYPKNEVLRYVVKNVELTDIVLETDAPFLPIQSMRGTQNAPSYIRDIAEYIAEIRKQSFHEVASRTTAQAEWLFALDYL